MFISTVAHNVRASITYTMAPSPFKGEASPGPFIASGVLRVESPGGSFAIPLGDLSIDANHWSIFPHSPKQGCGAGAPLGIHQARNGRAYVVVESIGIGKGCYAAVHLVDVATHRVVREYGIDHASDHADDVPASKFVSQQPFTVSSVETFAIPAGAPARSWTLTLIEGSDKEIFAENLRALETPQRGETLTLGVLHDQTFTAPLFFDDRIFRLSPAHERVWAARQTPVPAMLRRIRLYNMYFDYSDRLATGGHFAQALSAYRHALQYLDDANLRKEESAAIPRLAAIVQAVRDNRMSIAKAKKAWFQQ